MRLKWERQGIYRFHPRTTWVFKATGMELWSYGCSQTERGNVSCVYIYIKNIGFWIACFYK